MKAIAKFLGSRRNQIIVNGIISVILFVWILYIHEFTYYSSLIRDHYMFNSVLILTWIYLFQTFVNKKWMNSVLIAMYAILIGYVLYAYVYAFFDKFDVVMHKEYGVLIKTWGLFVKLVILATALWFSKKTRPNNLENEQ